MAIQRAVVTGLIAGTVATKNMFTCDVVESGGDDAKLLWEAYLDSVYTEAADILCGVWEGTTTELQAYTGGSWVPFDLFTNAYIGGTGADYLPNLVAYVLVGKAAGLRHMGRKFFSPLGEGSATANGLASAALVTAAAALLAYITPFTGIGGGTITPGVVDSTGTFHEFVGGSVSSLLGTMRRRKPGLGI